MRLVVNSNLWPKFEQKENVVMNPSTSVTANKIKDAPRHELQPMGDGDDVGRLEYFKVSEERIGADLNDYGLPHAGGNACTEGRGDLTKLFCATPSRGGNPNSCGDCRANGIAFYSDFIGGRRTSKECGCYDGSSYLCKDAMEVCGVTQGTVAIRTSEQTYDPNITFCDGNACADELYPDPTLRKFRLYRW